mmetsp:Transcript_20634/g.23374  ORF Transcript_20634/g.23374 Transcript_20634/m.23374 type:complete len:94 (-) Transcript_20634:670-951(-)
MDSDPMIEGMTQEFGSCDAYREDLLTKATTDQDLGALWLDDSIHALMIALENKGVLDNTIFLFQHDHGMEGKVCHNKISTSLLDQIFTSIDAF